MNISAASKLTGLSTKTLRYYEDIDLVTPARDALNGYRDFSAADIEQLQFVQRSRQAGFTLDECRTLLALFKDESRKSKHVKSFVLEKAAEVEQQIKQLQWIHHYLVDLASHCNDNEGPHCAILDELSHHELSEEARS